MTPSNPADRTNDAADHGGVVARGGKVDPEALRAQVAANASDNAETEGDAESGLAHVQFTLAHDLNKRLDKYLTDRITFLSRNQLQKLVEAGAVLVNGQPAKPSTKLRRGDVVDVTVPPPPPTDIQGEPIPIEKLFEDEHLIVINKQPDLIVHPARSHHSGTLLNGLVHHFAQYNAGGALSAVGKDVARPGVIHRLDRNTSGVMVVAKDDTAHWKLASQFEHRAVDKRYLALVEGIVEIDADVIEAPLGPSLSRVKGQREKVVVRHDELGKSAVTLYRVRQRFPLDAQVGLRGTRGYTLLELELKTGRTHQIRVHLAHLGYPIAADDMYGGHVVRAATIGLPSDGNDIVLSRQALHAGTLAFHHPITNTPVSFAAPLPEDIACVIRALRDTPQASDVLMPPGATLDLSQIIV